RSSDLNPPMWDLLWLAAFGIVPLAIGFAASRTPPSGRSGRQVRGAALLLLGALAAGSGAWALRPAPNQAFTTVAFAPGVSPQQVMSAVAAADARLVWMDPAVSVVVVEAEADKRWSFYRAGALLVSGSGLPAGCFGWSRL